MSVHDVKQFTVGDWLVEPDLDRLRRGDETRALRPQVTELLVYLAERQGEVVSAEALLDDLWSGKIVTSGSLYNCVAELRQALRTSDDEPPAIQTIPKRGYRLVATVNGIDGTAESPPDPVHSKPAISTTAKIVIGVLAGAVILIALLSRDRGSEVLDAPPASVRSIGVLPLQNLTGDSDRDYFADGITEALTSELGQVSELRVISRTTMMRYRDTNMRLPEIADELGIDALIEGSVQWDGREDVRITLQLIHGRSDHHLWAQSYSSSLQEVLALQQVAVQAIAGQIGIDPPASVSMQAAQRSPDPEALQLYLKGRYQFHRVGAGVLDALASFEEATELDPLFADAQAAHAWACMQPTVLFAGVLPLSRCIESAERALALDNSLAEAQAAAGFGQYLEWDWAGAEQRFERALSLNHNSVPALQAYADLLRTTGRSEEALTVLRRAETLDPLNLFVRTMVGWPLYNLRRYEDALAQWDRVLEVDPEFWLAHYNRGLVFIEQRDGAAVLEAAQLASERAPDPVAIRMLRITGHSLNGDDETARNILLEMEQEMGVDLAGWLAAAYVVLGDFDKALRWLEAGVAERVVGIAHHTSEPVFDPIREHPRFKAVRAAMQLP